MIAAYSGTVGLPEGIIDDSCLVILFFLILPWRPGDVEFWGQKSNEVERIAEILCIEIVFIISSKWLYFAITLENYCSCNLYFCFGMKKDYFN